MKHQQLSPHEPNTLRSQELEEPTTEQISQAYREESAWISTTLTSISRTRSSTANAQPNPSTSLFDLSGLVELRAAHETPQARNGVRNANCEAVVAGIPPSAGGSSEVDNRSDFKDARQRIIKQFYQLLRDAGVEDERVGTGLHRSHIWAGPSGNSLNAEKVAERRTNKVCSLPHPLEVNNVLIV